MTTVSPPPDDRIVVDVWSDIMCPFCYLGDTLLAQAVDQSGHDVEVRYHSYQLMSDLPLGVALDLDELLSERRGIPRAQAEAMNAQVTERAAQIGLDYHLDRAIATNTRPAHRLTHFASDHGRQHELVQRLFQAYFTEGRHVGDHDVLADLAAEIGLDREEARHALDTGAHEREVDADIEQARQLGITGVPFFVLDRTYAVSGAQPVETFVHALETAQQARGATET